MSEGVRKIRQRLGFRNLERSRVPVVSEEKILEVQKNVGNAGIRGTNRSYLWSILTLIFTTTDYARFVAQDTPDSHCTLATFFAMELSTILTNILYHHVLDKIRRFSVTHGHLEGPTTSCGPQMLTKSNASDSLNSFRSAAVLPEILPHFFFFFMVKFRSCARCSPPSLLYLSDA